MDIREYEESSAICKSSLKENINENYAHLPSFSSIEIDHMLPLKDHFQAKDEHVQ
jgi:hypothetical protein